ncbi:MAG: Hsp70 family protein [Oscillospiraceae bacterium]|nr:Hsp70 family protein [Oscillospiraceae bacterium]
MSKVYGIDLGTTYSAIATLDDKGVPEIIENYADSSPLLASAVYFPEGGTPVVGREAKVQAEIEPDRVVQFIKREIGKDNAGIYKIDGTEYDPITISALILKRMKEYAEEQGYEVNDVVITCPAYFGTEERNATRQAGIIAGLNVLNIINEPTAAALNYCSKEFKENQKILVYDLGGGTFDVTLFNFSVSEAGEASIEVLATDGDNHLGGADWDAQLFEDICRRYADKRSMERAELDKTVEEKIHNEVETVKRSLSSLTKKSFAINYDDIAVKVEVNRDSFEKETRELVDRTIDFVKQLLEKSHLTTDDIDTVLLVGGSSNMPMVKTAIDKLFEGKVRREEPDLAVAKGAALAAAIAWNETINKEPPKQGEGTKKGKTDSADDRKPINILGNIGSLSEDFFKDILSRSFGPGVMVGNNEYVIDNILFAGDPSPSKVSKVYVVPDDDLPEIDVPIFENLSIDHENTFVTPCVDIYYNPQETDPALKVKYLGEISIKLPEGTKRGTPIEIVFYYSTSGLDVTVINQITKERQQTQIVTQNTKTLEELKEDTDRFRTLKTSGQI